MAAPEAAVDEYNLAPWCKDEVGTPRKVAPVECVTIT